MRGRWALAGLASALIALGVLLAGGTAAGRRARHTRPPVLNRYSIVHRCLDLRRPGRGRRVITPGPFRLQASGLGQYLLYSPRRRYLSGRHGAGPALDSQPGAPAVWQVRGNGRRGFTLSNRASGSVLRARLVPGRGCAAYPEAQVDAFGHPFSGAAPQAAVNGTIDAHTHVTAFEFLGGDFHCGRPWHQFGVPYALPDCAPYQQGFNGQVESFLDYGSPGHAHDTRGWPTFRDWPSPTDLAEEGDYYTGIKRAWMAGLRVMVTHLVDNEALCGLMTTRHNPCDDMAAVHIQAADLRALQGYIDAQSGGPGKGFFRIVTNPFQARRVINSGKLAVVEGIEVSDLFHCATAERCSPAAIDSGLRDVRRLGVSTFFPVHKFDNAFGGARMDSGEEGVLINGGNHLESGHYFDVQTCTGPEHDNAQMNQVPAGGLSQLLNGPGRMLVPGGQVPIYPAAPHCNALGLTVLGTYLINRMIAQHFIVEADHMDVKTGNQMLSILERHHYSGVVSAHSWDDPGENRRIYDLGGFVTPIAGASPSAFLSQWRASLKIRNRRFYGGTGFGYGADMNGLAEQSQPSSGNPISYPFRSADGRVTFGRETWGRRVFDLNRDGVANYGMYPDWLQELQVLAGRPILNDMFRGAESYLEMWERAYGVPQSGCLPSHGVISSRGLGGIHLGESLRALLYSAGQPVSRLGRVYRYCVAGGRLAAAVFSPRTGRVAVVYTNARGYDLGPRRRGVYRFFASDAGRGPIVGVTSDRGRALVADVSGAGRP